MNARSSPSRGIVRAPSTTLSLSVSLLALLVFTGCAPNGQQAYRVLSSAAPNRVLASPSQTPHFASANRVVLPFREKFDLRSGDIVKLGSTYSYFRTFRLDVDSGAVYKIGARGLSTFWQGLVVIPLIYVLDEKGSVVAEGPSTYRLKMVFPAFMHDVIKSFDFSPRQRGSVFILIGADNGKSGWQAGSVGTSTSTPLGGGYGLVSGTSASTGTFWPVGAVRLQIDRAPPGARQ